MKPAPPDRKALSRRRRPRPDDTDQPVDEAAAARQILTWLMDGSNELEIRDGINEHLPGLSVDALLEKAFTHFEQVGTIGPPALIATYGWCMEATRELYRQMKAVGDFAGAMRAVKQMKDLADQAHQLWRPPPEPGAET